MSTSNVRLTPSEEDVIQAINSKSMDLIDRECRSEDLYPQVEVVDNKTRMVFRPQIGNEGGVVRIERVYPDPSAESQFLNRIGVPVNFFRKCTPGLRQSILEEHNRNKKFLLRCRTQESAETTCRAVVSPTFSREKDDQHIFPPVLEGLRGDNTRLARFEWSDHLSYLRADFTDCALTVGDVTAHASIAITNSETGHSSIWVIPSIIINGYEYANRYGEISKTVMRIIHRGEMPCTEDLRRGVLETKEIAQVGIVQYLKAQQEVVDIDHAIEFIRGIDDFPRRFSKILEENWQREKNIAKTRVMQEIVNAARELPLVQRLTVTGQVGRFIHLFEKVNEAKAELAELLNRS